MQPTKLKVTDLLPGPVADAASSILPLATALPLAQYVANAVAQTIGIAFVTPGHPIDTYPEEHQMVTTGTEVAPDLDAEEVENNIKARKSEKYL